MNIHDHLNMIIGMETETEEVRHVLFNSFINSLHAG